MTGDPITAVRVRMYRHGFGDCLLLRFLAGERCAFTMLIDAGIKYNTRSETAPFEDLIADLKQVLTPEGADRPRLDVLVVTHEHWDHVSFFHPTRFDDAFGGFDIDQVWMAWTEDPADDEATVINGRLREGVAALSLAARRLREAEPDAVEQLQGLFGGRAQKDARAAFNARLDDVLGLYGVSSTRKVSESGIVYKPSGKISPLTEQALEHVVQLAGGANKVRYHLPGTQVPAARLPAGVRVYVLGPPKNRLINKSNPSRGADHETYMRLDGAGLTGFVDGLLAMGEGGATAADPARPFAADVGLSPEDAEQHPYLAGTYFAPGERHRQIEHSWLDIAGQLALQLDGAINNTSLVLAIELVASGQVLLFPGDAQVGSWLSWHEHTWTVDGECGPRSVTAADLLERTVLYKVSHHGSHNATLQDQGLELMTDPALVAFVPEKEDSYSGIPYDKLMKALRRRCKGRVVVSADANHPPEDLLTTRPDELTESEWQALQQDLTVTPLYVEHIVRTG